MFNILEADIEQISQLMQFAEAMLEYHRQCSEILQVCSIFIIGHTEPYDNDVTMIVMTMM